jgi:hypothetical protein
VLTAGITAGLIDIENCEKVLIYVVISVKRKALLMNKGFEEFIFKIS